MASALPTETSQSDSHPDSSKPKVNPLQEIDEKDLERHELIGSGSFSDVYRATLTSKDKKTKKEVAEKILRPTKPEERKDQEREIHFLNRLRHRYIISLVGVVLSAASIIILTEFASNGSLHDYLKNVTRLPAELLYAWALQGALAIQHLQRNNVSHRDIKSSNFVITKENVLKLCDFGISRDLKTTVETAQKGTIEYLAPEVFKELKLSKASDIYAYGIVLWELVTCEEPYKDTKGMIVYVVGIKNRRPDISGIAHPLLNLIRQCWATNRTRRPHIDEVIRDIIHAGEQERAFQWDLHKCIKLSSAPGPMAISPDGSKIAVCLSMPDSSNKIEIYAAIGDDQEGNNSCLHSIPFEQICYDMAFGYNNYLYAAGAGMLAYQISSNEFKKVHFVKKCTTLYSTIATSTVPNIAANSSSDKLYSFGLHSSPTILVLNLKLVPKVSDHHNSTLTNEYLIEYRMIAQSDDMAPHNQPTFMDFGAHGTLLTGNSQRVDLSIFDDNHKWLETLETFKPPETWLFVKARFAPAPKANPDIYAICKNDPMWYNFVIYKFVWQKEAGYKAAGCIAAGLDKPCDIQVTTEGDVICSESGKNRVVVYRVKNVQ